MTAIIFLNRIIIGWGMYYRRVSSAKTFRKLDHFIWWRIFRTAYRLHHRRGEKFAQFIVRQRVAYRFDINAKNRARAGAHFGVWADGEHKQAYLITGLRFIPIRYVQLHPQLNPYHPEERAKLESLRGLNEHIAELEQDALKITDEYGPEWNVIRSAVLAEAGYKCERCGRSVQGQTAHVHHVIPLKRSKSRRQANLRENLVCLCPSCHARVERDGETPYPSHGPLFPDRKVIGYWVQPGAQAYDDNETCRDTPTGFHGTHTSGSVAGDSGQTPSTPSNPGVDVGDGMAPNAQLLFQDVGDANGCLAGLGQKSSMFAQAIAGGARVHSNSYGSESNGNYSSDDQATDRFLFDHEEMSIVFSAGTSGPGATSIGSPGVSKNTITVGALGHGENTAIARFSSRGPTVDGRINMSRRAKRRAAAALLALAALAPARAAGPVVEDSIAQRMQACTVCHGREGRATPDGYFPRIAGKPAGYLYNQLVNFRDGRRRYAPMTYLVEHLSDAYLHEIAGHFATLDLPYAPPLPAQAPAAVLAQGERLVREGDAARELPACTRCHGERMAGAEPAIPGLLGLPRDYLLAQFGAWRTGQRRPAPCLEPGPVLGSRSHGVVPTFRGCLTPRQ